MSAIDRSKPFILTTLALAAVSGGIYLYQHARATNGALPQREAVDAARGAPVELKLTDAEGRPFDLASLSGKPVAVFFGFTNCPDVCPMTLQRLALMREKIGGRFDDLHVLFVTLDPERDTPATLKSYFSSMPIPVTGLTGTAEQIAKAAKQFGVYYETVRYSESDYTIDHTASLFLLDRTGRRAGEIGFDSEEAEFEEKLREAIK